LEDLKKTILFFPLPAPSSSEHILKGVDEQIILNTRKRKENQRFYHNWRKLFWWGGDASELRKENESS